MEEKKNNIPKLRNSVKIRDIHSKFKNARKISVSKESECAKKEKRVMFLEPPKAKNIKRSQVIRNPKILEQKLHTEIEQAISKKNRNKIRKPSLKKSHTTNGFARMPVLKTKVVNIHTHYFIPVLNKFEPKTFITKNNPLKGQKVKLKYKRKYTFEKDALNKKSEELDINFKKSKIPHKRESKKEILRKNTQENGRRYENKYESNKSNKIPYDDHNKNYNANDPESEKKNMRSMSRGENTSNTGINENNKEEDIKDIKIIKENNDSNKIIEKDDNLTDNINVHKKNNSVDAKREKKNKNNNIFKKLFCCLNG